MSADTDAHNGHSNGSVITDIKNSDILELIPDSHKAETPLSPHKLFQLVGDYSEWLVCTKLVGLTHWRFGLLVVFLGLLAYSPNIVVDSDNPWIYDDQVSILRNPCVMGVDPFEEYVPWSCLLYVDYWGTPIHTNKSHKSYRPVTSFFHRLQNTVFTLNEPRLWHFTSTVLHCITAVLFYVAMQEFTKELEKQQAIIGSRLATLLFVLHPVHTESVSNFTGLAEVLCALFMLLSYVIYERRSGGEIVSFLGAVLCSLLATLSKEVGVSVLAIIIVSIISKEIMYIKRILNKKHETQSGGIKVLWNSVKCYVLQFRLKSLLLVVAYLVAAAGTVAARLLINVEKPTFSTGMNPGGFNKDPLTRILTLLFYVVKHFGLLVFPYYLCPDYANSAIPLLESVLDSRMFWLLALFVPLLISLKVILEKLFSVKSRHHAMVLGLAWLVLPFIPSSNLFIIVGFAVAERVLFSPSIGFCMLVGLGAAAVSRFLYQRKQKLMKRLFYSSLSVFLSCLMVRTMSRDYDWNNATRLWLRSYAICSPSGAIVANSALCLKDLHRMEEAIHMMRYVVAIGKDEINPQSMLNLAQALRETGKLEEAQKICEGPASHGDLGALACMADIHFRRKEFKETFDAYHAILESPDLDPRHMPVPKEKAIMDSLVSLRMLAVESGEFDVFDMYAEKAMEEKGTKERFRCLVKLEKGKAAGHQNLQFVRDKLFSEVLQMCPNDMDLYMGIGEFLKNSKEFEASKAILAEAEERLPHFSYIIKRRTMEVELESYITYNLNTTYEDDIIAHELHVQLLEETPLNCIYLLAKDFVQHRFTMRGGLDLLMMKDELRKAFEGYEFEQVSSFFLAHINKTMDGHEFGVIEAYSKIVGDNPEQVANFFRDIRESLDAFSKFMKSTPPAI